MRPAKIALCLLLIGASPSPSAPAQEPKAELTPAQRRHRSEALDRIVAGERARIAAQLADTVASREAAARDAEAEFREAKLTREVAEYAVKEYVEGVYVQDLETLKGDLALAQADRQCAIDDLAGLRAAEAQGQRIGRNRLITAELEEVKSKFALEQAETALQILQRYERERSIKFLGAKVDEARKAEELARLKSDQRTKELARRRQQGDDAGTRSPEDLLVNLLDKVVQGEGELARLAREAAAADELVTKDPASAEARAKVEAIRKSLRSQAEATRDTLRDAIELAEETATLRQRYADAEKRAIAERKAALHLPPSPIDQFRDPKP